MTFVPYANEVATMRLGQMTLENRVDRVSLYGSLDLTRDKVGLAQARRLRALLEATVAALEAEGDKLPDRVRTGEHTDQVKNPFN
ncbi:hypothetical protein [Roseomonas chloroacetimidivorans]|uniref:hypothetical protein n=1 Tax=Roseomonas chloroacetimidivorans TaxID=1766656 RepID=UPI003C70EDCA